MRARDWGLDEDVLERRSTRGCWWTRAARSRCSHPLVRSAIYQAATAADRRGAHRALAGALAGSGHEDREVWHRAYAAEGPDADLVDALEGVGERSQRRGGHVAALAAYERAAELSTDAARRAHLSFAAARSAWACGQAARAQALLGAAREGTEDPLLLCDVARLRGHIEVNIGSAPEAHRIFVDAAHAVLAGRPGPCPGHRRRRGRDAHLRCRQRDADCTPMSS